MPLRALGDLLVPPRCGGCLAPGPTLCPTCRERIGELALADLGWTRLHDGLLAVAAFAYAGALAQALKRAKTPGGHAGAPALAALLWRCIGTDPRDFGTPVTWVPSVRRSTRSRAVALPQVLAGPAAVRLLARTGSPPDQTTLDPRRRRRSPHGTFRALGAVPSSVVLVDDVRTTGATALAAADALAAAGARRVLVVTLALAGQDAGARVRVPAGPGSARTARSR